MTVKESHSISSAKNLNLINKNDENNMNNMNKMKLKSKHFQAVKVQQVEVPPSNLQTCEGNSRIPAERVGDWVCFSCSNLNFSFRKICNRCKLSRDMSDMNYCNMENNPMCSSQMGLPLPSVTSSSHYP